MSPAIVQLYLDQRRRDMSLIAQAAEKYKVCAQCLSVSYKREAVCRVCHSYRWHESVEAVWVVTDAMKRRPFPVTSPVAPRLLLDCPKLLNDHVDADPRTDPGPTLPALIEKFQNGLNDN